MSRTETRFGVATSLGATYTSLGTVPASTTWNVLLNITNRTSGAVNCRIYIASSSWTTGEPTGGNYIVAAIAYDHSIAPGEIYQVSGFVMNATEKLIVYSGTASALDIVASGVAVA